jgi:regulatory protein
MMEEPLRKKAEQKAYRLLALRAHSEKELQTKLRGGGFAEPVVEAVIEKCRELGYLNDGNYARQRARDLAVNRLAGDRRIAFDLRERGISEELSRQSIAEVRGELSQEEAVDRILGKYSKESAISGMDVREKAKWMRRLMGKGFPTGLIYRKIKGIEEEGVHDDEGE